MKRFILAFLMSTTVLIGSWLCACLTGAIVASFFSDGDTMLGWVIGMPLGFISGLIGISLLVRKILRKKCD